MQDFETKSLSFDADDELHNPRPAEQDFDRVPGGDTLTHLHGPPRMGGGEPGRD